MKIIVTIVLVINILLGGQSMSIYNIKVKDIDGNEFTLEKYKNKVMLIVSVDLQDSTRGLKSFMKTMQIKA